MSEWVPALCVFSLWAACAAVDWWYAFRLKRKAQESERWKRYFIDEEIRHLRQ
ncbi:MAG: hypothetical protein ABWY12_09730 [Burkholderiales bacterium]